MDNGHKNLQRDNFADVDANLNEDNWQKSLEISKPVDLPSPESLNPSLAETAESELKEPQPEEPTLAPEFTPPESAKLGQITTIGTTSISETPEKKYSQIRTTGDHLDKAAITEIDNAIEELDQTGNISSFYDKARAMTESNLSNSFNNKPYDGKEGS